MTCFNYGVFAEVTLCPFRAKALRRPSSFCVFTVGNTLGSQLLCWSNHLRDCVERPLDEDGLGGPNYVQKHGLSFQLSEATQVAPSKTSQGTAQRAQRRCRNQEQIKQWWF